MTKSRQAILALVSWITHKPHRAIKILQEFIHTFFYFALVLQSKLGSYIEKKTLLLKPQL